MQRTIIQPDLRVAGLILLFGLFLHGLLPDRFDPMPRDGFLIDVLFGAQFLGAFLIVCSFLTPDSFKPPHRKAVILALIPLVSFMLAWLVSAASLLGIYLLTEGRVD